MPLYEYSCNSCGHEFELMRLFSDTSTPACPKCAGGNVQRLLSRPAIHFKGSGWYITDSKNSAKESATGTKKEVSSDSDKPRENAADKAADSNSAKTPEKPTEKSE